MKTTGIVSTICFVVTVSLAILGLSTQFALRAPVTYSFHFNDSQSIQKTGHDVEISEMAGAIGIYLSRPGAGKFQVYEKNGEYRDPVFSRKDQGIMKKFRRALNMELAAVLCITALAALLFAFMSREELREWRFLASVAAIPSAGVMIVIRGILAGSGPVQSALYRAFIGIQPGKKDTLYLLMGTGFAKAYEIFSVGAAIVLLMLFSYGVFRSRLQKKRIFY